MKLWLDDMRPANYDEAIDLIAEHSAEITDVSLDHDLCPAHTGCDVLEFLLESGLKPRIEIHTMNPAGMQRMTDLLDAFEAIP